MQWLKKCWPRQIFAYILGGFGGLAFAPTFFIPLLVIAFLGAFIVLNLYVTQKKEAFWFGWWFGFGHFTIGLYWVSFSLGVDLDKFGWLIPFTIMGLPAILAFFSACAFLLTFFIPQGLMRALAFGCAWCVMEWLRGHIFTGFPWNLVGYIWSNNLQIAQIVSVTGVYGLSFLTVTVCVFFSFIKSIKKIEKMMVVVSLCVFPILWIWGHYRLENSLIQNEDAPWIRIVQPNTSQILKWDNYQKQKNFQELLRITAIPSKYPLKAVIWPETAVPYFLNHEPYLLQQIATSLPQGAFLLTGALRKTDVDIVPFQLWNSFFIVNSKGNIETFYDKSHLVPFGEYIPLREFINKFIDISFVKKITAGSIDFSVGKGASTLDFADFPSLSPLICYEAIFPHKVIDKNKRPEWLLNITNDAWFGNSSGPYQHLEIARMRAIEEGLPLIRVANTGISAVFDAYGKKIAAIGLNQSGWLDVQLPPFLTQATFYGYYGDWMVYLAFGALLIMFLFQRKKTS